MNDSTVAYWTSGVAPSPADDRRLPADPARLVQLVMERSVALRGWNYPHVPRSDAQQGVTSLPDGGIEAAISTGRYQEVWRLHPSGLFTHRWRLREDGISGYRGTINVTAAVYTVTEVFEFGRRLYQEDTTVETVTFRVALEDVLGRPASGDLINDPLNGNQARRNTARYVAELPRADLAAGIAGPATAAAGSLFGQLGFADVSRGFIESKTRAFLLGQI
jgi:hypothetical protein